MAIEQISPQALKARLEAGEDLVLLDVREDWEFQQAHIEGALHIPMQTIPGRVDELDQQRPVVAVCHHGVRSLHVAHYLERAGFSQLYNLTGGIDAWALEVDPDVPRY